MTPPTPEAPVPSTQKWAITFTVMVVAFMQILDTSVTNVVLPHLQGSLSAGLDEVSCRATCPTTSSPCVATHAANACDEATNPMRSSFGT